MTEALRTCRQLAPHRDGCYHPADVAKDTSLNDFGLLIAYILPGFTALWGAAYGSESLQSWIGISPADAPTVGGFLYTTVAAVAAGLTVSTVRWLLLDALHHRTGVRPPDWDFSLLGDRVQAFGVLVDIHYRYYQFYANMLLALLWSYAVRRLSLGLWSAPLAWPDVGFALLAAVFFLGSRDALGKYYARTGQLLAARRRRVSPRRGGRGRAGPSRRAGRTPRGSPGLVASHPPDLAPRP